MSRRGLDIASLTPEERLSLLEELWDSLAAAPEAVPLTEAQRAEAVGTGEAGRRPPPTSRTPIKGDLFAFRSYLLSRDVNLTFNVETATSRLESRGTSIFLTGRVRKDLAGTAWDARLRPVDIGPRPPRLADVEIYQLGTPAGPGARPGGGTE